MGFLTLEGSETLVPLDGQHRAKAFKYAIDGVDDNGRPIATIRSNLELPNDQVAVILVRFNSQRARMIFNKLNRYAKPTSRPDNLITDDDDAVAVISRKLLSDEEDSVLPIRMVKIGTTSLAANAPEWTTLSTFYDINDALVKGLRIVSDGTPKQMNVDQQEVVIDQLKPAWARLCSRVDLWVQALEDPSEKGDQRRIEIREQTLLGKPIGQLSLIRAFLFMRDRCAGVSEEDLLDRLNQVSWGVRDPIWNNVLMNPSNGRVLAGVRYVNRASVLIGHLCGVQLTEAEQKELLEQIHGDEWESHELPAPITS